MSEFTLSVAAPTVKPNPPSNVVVQQEEGQETRMTVTWELPTSWNSQGNFFKLTFELKYRPLVSSLHYEQVRKRRRAVGFLCFLCVFTFHTHSVIQCTFGCFILKHIQNSDNKSVNVFFNSLPACVSMAVGGTDKGSLL